MKRVSEVVCNVLAAAAFMGAVVWAALGLVGRIEPEPAGPESPSVQWLGFPVSGFPDGEGKVNSRAFFENQIGLRDDGVVVWRGVDAEGR